MSRRKRNTSTRFSLFSFQDIITCVMGIMLLLTLLICLQITDSVSRSSSEVQTRTTELQTVVASQQIELADLEVSVRSNSAILQSGGLSNTQLLRNEQQAAEASRAAAERELISLLQQSTTVMQSLDDLKSSVLSRQALSTEEIAKLIEETKRQQQAVRDIQDGRRIVYNRYVGGADTCWIIEVSSDTDFKVAAVGKKEAPVSFSSLDQVIRWTYERHKEGAEFLVLLKPNANVAIDRLPGTLREAGIPHGYDLLGQDQTALDPVTGAELL